MAKEFYVCLVEFKDRPTAEPRRFLTTAIASSQDEAKELAIKNAARQLGAKLNTGLVDASADIVNHETLEAAAREVLGWSG